MSCEHTDFEANVDVGRVTSEASADPFAYIAEITVRCKDCGAPFGWRGLGCGLTTNGAPLRSDDALELRAWLVSPSELELTQPPHGFNAP